MKIQGVRTPGQLDKRDTTWTSLSMNLVQLNGLTIFEIRPSLIKGRGLFATRNIRKGEGVVRW